MSNFISLRTVLVSLYPTPADARRVVADAGLNSAYIQFSDKAINNWHDILTEAEKRGSMDALLAIVLEEYGTNSALVNAAQAYRANSQPRAANAEKPASPNYTINTGGGPYIAGNVNTGGGDFVGRDSSKRNKK